MAITEALQALYNTEFQINSCRPTATILWEKGLLIPSNFDFYVYTDGSFKHDRFHDIKTAGAAFCVWSSAGEEILSSNYEVIPATDSYHSETLALHAALHDMTEILHTNIGNKRLCILSDLKSLLSHLHSLSLSLSPRSSGEVIEIADKLHELQAIGCHINLTWIPGHIGIPGNERADELAGNITRNSRKLCSQLQYSTLKQWIKKSHQDELDCLLRRETKKPSSNDFAAPRNIFSAHTNNPPPGSIAERRVEISFFRLLAGHCNIGAHWLRRGRRNVQYMCRRCQYSLETAEHLLIYCPAIPENHAAIAKKLKLARSRHDTFSKFLSAMNDETKSILIEMIYNLHKCGVVL